MEKRLYSRIIEYIKRDEFNGYYLVHFGEHRLILAEKRIKDVVEVQLYKNADALLYDMAEQLCDIVTAVPYGKAATKFMKEYPFSSTYMDHLDIRNFKELPY